MDLHSDDLTRDRIIAAYLRREMDPAETEEFEAHYLSCPDCFLELRSMELMLDALRTWAVTRRTIGGVAVIEFTEPVQLTSTSDAGRALLDHVRTQQDRQVLIDLSKVSRIDSAGLGMLIACYTHVIRADGALKFLHANDNVKRVLGVTGIDSVIQTYQHEAEALTSFSAGHG